MFINHTSKQVTAKIVYYGPGLGGKTTNLQYVFSVTNEKSRGELVCIETDVERTLFFDLLPINVGLIKGYLTKFQLYTVPGQIFYDATRKMVLKGADGIVFVCDSQSVMSKSNINSFENLVTNLAEHNRKIEDVPLVFQYNKRDLSYISSIEGLNILMNKSMRHDYFSAVAIEGKGVLETLRKITSLTLTKIKEAIDISQSKIFKSPEIKFDTNEKKEIIKKEDLPIKKISYNTDKEENKDSSYLKEEESAKEPEKENENLKTENPEVQIALYEPVNDSDQDESYETQEQIDLPEDLPKIESFETDEPVDEAATPPVEKEKIDRKLTAKTESAPKSKQKPVDKKTGKKEKSQKTTKPINKRDKNLELLDGLTDKSKLTVLKKIQPLNSRITIEIKDKNNNTIETLELDTSAKTKKITLILDLKK